MSATTTIFSSAEAQIEKDGNVHRANNDDERRSPKGEGLLLLEEIFPNDGSLARYWERSPVHLPAKRILDEEMKDAFPRANPTSDRASDRFSRLFSTEDAYHVLRERPGLVQGRDYHVLRYVSRDGEEWNGRVPFEQMSANDVKRAVEGHAFSLVINELERRWTPVRELARTLSWELAVDVSCNSYSTPPRAARAFESHLDWMDAIVLQIEGVKDWDVAVRPLVELVPPDRKRKPTVDELRRTEFRRVRLRPGDALYVPRGYLHNATTTDDDDDDDDHHATSTHLTLGLEHGHGTTYEALAHVAVESYRRRVVSVRDDRRPVATCDDGRTVIVVDPIRLLHYSVSALSRRTSCGGYGERRRRSSSSTDTAPCLLRQSVPLDPRLRSSLGRTEADVEETYSRSIRGIRDGANANDAIDFWNEVNDDDAATAATIELGSTEFFYPGMTDDETPPARLCDRSHARVDDAAWEELVEEFHAHAKDRFFEIRQELVDWNEIELSRKWRDAEQE